MHGRAAGISRSGMSFSATKRPGIMEKKLTYPVETKKKLIVTQPLQMNGATMLSHSLEGLIQLVTG